MMYYKTKLNSTKIENDFYQQYYYTHLKYFLNYYPIYNSKFKYKSTGK
jgi:hypothetical protein